MKWLLISNSPTGLFKVLVVAHGALWYFPKLLYGNTGNFFKAYGTSGYTDSLQLVAGHGTYLAIGFVFSYSVISSDPIIAIVSGHDGYGADNRVQTMVVHKSPAFEISVALTDKETITVTLDYKYEGIQHYRLALFKLMN